MRFTPSFPTLKVLATAALAVALLGTCPCQAVTSEGSGSILFFPGIVVGSERDTRIQISNYSNNLRSALCLYVEERQFPGQPSRQHMHFQIRLERQSTLQWSASTGLQQIPPPCGSNSTCFVPRHLIFGPQGLLIPRLDVGFSGALLCVETDPADFPVSGNALLGVVSTYDLLSGEVSQNNAIAVAGFDTNDGNDTLCLGGEVTNNCPTGSEYDGCPRRWYFDAIAAGGGTLTASDNSGGELVITSCAQDFLNDTPGTASLIFRVWDQFGSQLSSSGSLAGYTTRTLQSINANANIFGSETSGIEITASAGILVAGGERLEFSSAASTTAAQAGHAADAPQAGALVLPPR